MRQPSSIIASINSGRPDPDGGNAVADEKRVSSLAALLAFGLIVWPPLWVLDPFHFIQSRLVVEQFALGELGLCLAWAAIVRLPALRPIFRPVIAALVLALCLWLLLRYQSLTLSMYDDRSDTLVLSCLMTGVCFLAGWLFAGRSLTGLIALFLVYGLVSMNFPDTFSALGGSTKTFLIYMTFGSDAIVGQTLIVVTVTVSVFVLFGRAFLLAGGAEVINDLALWVGGKGSGAPVKAAVIASGLFGTISGNATSNVLTVGSVTIPLMIRHGVRPATAGGIEAVASTGGQLMPPVMGAAAFLMAELTGIPYAEIALSALMPALLFYFVLLVEAHHIGKATAGLATSDAPRVRPRTAVIALGVFGLVIISVCALLFWFSYAPEWAAVMGIFLCGVIALLRHRQLPAFSVLARELADIAAILMPLVVTGAIVGVMLAVIHSSGLGVMLAFMLERIGGTSLFLSLLVAAAASYLLGLSLSTSAVYIISAVLVAPGLVNLGVPLVAAHLFVLYMAMLSMISPPVAFACLATCGLTGASFEATCREAFRFSLVIFWIPFVFIYNPGLLLLGTPWDILTALVTAFAAALTACAALSKMRLATASRPAILAYGLLSIALVLPVIPSLARLGVAVLIVLWSLRGLTGLRGRGPQSVSERAP
jgi:TRAP transporter 4TM/12TM fusion protein